MKRKEIEKTTCIVISLICSQSYGHLGIVLIFKFQIFNFRKFVTNLNLNSYCI